MGKYNIGLTIPKWMIIIMFLYDKKDTIAATIVKKTHITTRYAYDLLILLTTEDIVERWAKKRSKYVYYNLTPKGVIMAHHLLKFRELKEKK